MADSKPSRNYLRLFRLCRHHERELDDEIQHHLDQATELLVRRGMSHPEAAREAMRRFGNVDWVRRECERLDRRHSIRTTVIEALHSVYQDVSIGLRGFVRHPWFTATAIVTLALGIGATTGIFSLVNWLLVRPVPGVQHRDGLAIVRFGKENGQSYSPGSVSYANLRDIVQRAPAVQTMAGIQGSHLSLAAGGTLPRRVEGEFVMPDYFHMLGTVPTAGRLLVPEDDKEPAGTAVALLCTRLARTLFGDPATAVTRTIRVNGIQVVVIGVAPVGFHGTERMGNVDIWFPGHLYFTIHRIDQQFRDSFERRNGIHHYFLMALTPGATFDQAEGQLEVATRTLADAYPDENAKFLASTSYVYPGIGLSPGIRQNANRIVQLLTAVVGIVLLITCTNVANLFLFRGVYRQKESAIRKAMGAGRARLARQRLTETIVLSVMGGIVGLVLAVGFTSGFRAFRIPGVGELTDLAIDWRVALFAFGLALVTGALCGIVPALAAAKIEAVRGMGPTRPLGPQRRIRALFTLFQLSATLALLVGALALTRTLTSLTTVDLGFDETGLVSFWVDLESHEYDDGRAMAFQAEFTQRARGLPGVVNVSTSNYRPFLGISFLERVRLPGETREDAQQVASNGVSSSYFETLGIPVLSGRPFTVGEATELSTDRVYPVIVNRQLATLLLGGIDPVGRSMILPGPQNEADRQHPIVGMVGNSRWTDLEGDSEPLLYVPFARSKSGVADFTVQVKVRDGVALPTEVIREVAASIDSDVPLDAPRVLADDVAKQFAEERLLATTFLLLGGLAVVLAAVGLYGLLAQGVAERIREFGIRMATGAAPSRIFALVTRESAVLGAVGILIGLGGAAGVMKLLEHWLFGVSAVEPAIHAVATAMLASVMLLATFIPARSATRVDPTAALRTE